MTLNIGFVVGELSGENLAVGIIQELLRRNISFRCCGICGEQLKSLGCKQLYSQDELSCMGLEPIFKLPRLIYIRSTLVKKFVFEEKIDLFIGIDAPDFNLGLEKKLHDQGIKTVHYVSPSIWAWRYSRIKLIKKAVDLVLTLFNFELKYYQAEQIPAVCVGHHFADRVPENVDSKSAKISLGITNKIALLVMPGSRISEVKRLMPIYLQVMKECYKRENNLHFLLAASSQRIYELINKFLGDKTDNMPISCKLAQNDLLMTACDLALVTSGTASLEVMCYRKPMIIVYKTDTMTYLLAKMLIKVKYIGLPNILAEHKIVPEYIQHDASAQNIACALINLINSKDLQNKQISEFIKLYYSLKLKANVLAVDAILNIL